jgi:hypothetical protein
MVHPKDTISEALLRNLSIIRKMKKDSLWKIQNRSILKWIPRRVLVNVMGFVLNSIDCVSNLNGLYLSYRTFAHLSDFRKVPSLCIRCLQLLPLCHVQSESVERCSWAVFLRDFDNELHSVLFTYCQETSANDSVHLS